MKDAVLTPSFVMRSRAAFIDLEAHAYEHLGLDMAPFLRALNEDANNVSSAIKLAPGRYRSLLGALYGWNTHPRDVSNAFESAVKAVEICDQLITSELPRLGLIYAREIILVLNFFLVPALEYCCHKHVHLRNVENGIEKFSHFEYGPLRRYVTVFSAILDNRDRVLRSLAKAVLKCFCLTEIGCRCAVGDEGKSDAKYIIGSIAWFPDTGADFAGLVKVMGPVVPAPPLPEKFAVEDVLRALCRFSDMATKLSFDKSSLSSCLQDSSEDVHRLAKVECLSPDKDLGNPGETML